MPEPKMPHAGPWRRQLASLTSPEEAARLMDRVESSYRQLYRDRTHYEHPALRQHLEGSILPGLALYRVLRASGYDKGDALQTVERVTAPEVLRQRRPLALMGRLPFAFALLRALTPGVMARNFPPQGWQAEWRDEGPDVVAFDMTRCFYMDVFMAYGAPELTAVYCNLDDVMYGDLSPHVRWERTRTLGRGDDVCDFGFRRA